MSDAGNTQIDASSPGRVTGFFHVGVTVHDMAESLHFYCEGLGFTLLTRYIRDGRTMSQVVGVEPQDVDVCFLQIPGSDAQLELFEYHGVERDQVRARPCDVGFGHFCVYVDDLTQVYRRLTTLGYRSIRPIHKVQGGAVPGAHVVYFLDPNGFAVEIIQKAVEG